jgi:nucleoside-diphosphate-sugar epimerase
MTKPGLIITGATGFLGSRLIKELHPHYEIYAVGRRTPQEAGALQGPDIHWFCVDIGYFEPLREVFYRIRQLGGADLLLHLAGYYDFTGEQHPEYLRTNVNGTRNVLELAAPLNLKRLFFTSSIAACPFPKPGEFITEDTPPTASPPYSQSKRQGEEMLRAYRDYIPSCIVRLAAIFSDWCEYEPLDNFLHTWCSNRWNARILGGRGLWAIPYLHARDLLLFYLRVIEKHGELQSLEVLQGSPDGATTHLDLYRTATYSFYGAPRRPICMPKPLARLGIAMREAVGRATGHMPFERSWMGEYIDLQLAVDASRTRHRLDWSPNPDLFILKRIPFMIQNMRQHPDQWQQRNDQWKRARGRQHQFEQAFLEDSTPKSHSVNP